MGNYGLGKCTPGSQTKDQRFPKTQTGKHFGFKITLGNVFIHLKCGLGHICFSQINSLIKIVFECSIFYMQEF